MAGIGVRGQIGWPGARQGTLTLEGDRFSASLTGTAGKFTLPADRGVLAVQPDAGSSDTFFSLEISRPGESAVLADRRGLLRNGTALLSGFSPCGFPRYVHSAASVMIPVVRSATARWTSDGRAGSPISIGPEGSMKITVRQRFPDFFYFHAGERIARSTASFLDSSSTGAVAGIGALCAQASGVFGWYRFELSVDGRRTHVFRKSFWSKLYDRRRATTLWNGEVEVSGRTVARFRRAKSGLTTSGFHLDLTNREHLPLAVAYLPYAIANRHF